MTEGDHSARSGDAEGMKCPGMGVSRASVVFVSELLGRILFPELAACC